MNTRNLNRYYRKSPAKVIFSKQLGNTISASLQNLKSHLRKFSLYEGIIGKTQKCHAIEKKKNYIMGWRSKSIEDSMGNLRVRGGH